MKKKNVLQTSILIAALCVMNQFSNAQIIYTDVIPDFTVLSGGYNLDLNNDGITDFVFTDTTYYATSHCGNLVRTSVKVLPLDSNEVLGNANPANYIIESASTTWLDSVSQTLVLHQAICINVCCAMNPHAYCCSHPQSNDFHLSYYNSGQWYGVTDKYLGLKFHVGLNTYYGWARMSGLGYTVMIKDYAYNSIPNQAIVAGDTENIATGIIHYRNKNRLAIYPNPVSNSTRISFSIPQAQKISLKIFDVNGRLVKTLFDEEMGDGEHQINWSTNGVNAGVYSLQFQSAEFSKMEKIIVTQ